MEGLDCSLLDKGSDEEMDSSTNDIRSSTPIHKSPAFCPRTHPIR
jgi:hypothetical protein